MTLKQKAILQTVGIIFGIIFGSVLIQTLIFFLSAQTIGYILTGAFIILMVRLIYQIVLGRLESQETLDNIAAKMNKTVV
jgi:hypothetical protein